MKIIAHGSALLLLAGLLAAALSSSSQEEDERRSLLRTPSGLLFGGRDSALEEEASEGSEGSRWFGNFGSNGLRLPGLGRQNNIARTEGNPSPGRCRGKNLGPHFQSLWQSEFPESGYQNPKALCEGSIRMGSDFSVCTDGRVSYNQIAEFMRQNDPPRYIRAPASGTISVPGHLIGGTTNFVLGTEANLMVDYIANYTVGGNTFAAGTNMNNNLLAASRGVVTQICFTPEFSKEEEFYKLSQKVYRPYIKSVNFDEVSQSNNVYIGPWTVVSERHEVRDRSDFLAFFGNTQLSLITFAATLSPAFVAGIVPLLGLTGIFRLFTTGIISTAKFPQPITAPDLDVEDIQINTEWTTYISALENGLFLNGPRKVPTYFGTFAKKIQSKSGFGCWNVETAAIDIQAPQGWGDKLDSYVNDQVLPALEEHGTVDIHMGKRLDSNSRILQTAMSRYNTQCGVELDVTPTESCWHPMCKRNSNVENFQFPQSLTEEG